MSNTSDYTASPCIGVCMLTKNRTILLLVQAAKELHHEIRNWTILTNKQREDIIAETQK